MTSIDVTLTLASPLYVAYPGNYDDTKKISYTTKLPVMVDGQLQYIPYYPANGFRGALRRKAMGRLLKHFTETEGPLPGDLYLGLSCGASSGSPDSTARSVEELLRARANVYMGLFGGGARLHPSSYRVSDMLPIIASTIKTGMVPSRFAEYVKSRTSESGEKYYVQSKQLVSFRNSIRVDDLFRVMNPGQILSSVADPQATVAKYQSAVLGNRADRKAEDESKKSEPSNRARRKADDELRKSDVSHMLTIETIAPGVPFHFRIDLDDAVVDDAKIGLILLSLSDLFVANQFGGWGRCGFGKVRVESILINGDGDSLSLGDFYSTNDTFSLPGTTQPFVDAANEAIGTLSIADMKGFFEDFSADAKAQKAAEAKAKKAAKEAAKEAV